MNRTFSEFATNTAFTISLSKTQCNALLRTAAEDDGSEHLFAVGVDTLHALERKGLVYWHRDASGHANGFGGLTKAGELLVGLLHEAGMSVDSTNTVRVLKRIA